MSTEVNKIDRASLEDALRSLGSEDRKAAIRLVNDTLGISILKDINSFSEQCNRLFNVLPALITRATDNIETDIGLLDTEACLAYSEKLLEIMHKNIALKVKIAQGKRLFPDTVLSSDEQFIIDLMNSLSSAEEKTKFIEALRGALAQTKNESGDESAQIEEDLHTDTEEDSYAGTVEVEDDEIELPL